MPFLLAEILNFQGLAHLIGVGSFSNIILYSKNSVVAILQNMDISILQELHEKFASDKWADIDDDCSDEDYITNYLRKMDSTNLSFLL